uniref:Uncharacterized protein n=1 Tax=Timema shepardi TaxID=629360 RepID=A0A7R9BCL4_TIMSH|nr:unnamed protein product [Timema shepardi]
MDRGGESSLLQGEHRIGRGILTETRATARNRLKGVSFDASVCAPSTAGTKGGSTRYIPGGADGGDSWVKVNVTTLTHEESTAAQQDTDANTIPTTLVGDVETTAMQTDSSTSATEMATPATTGESDAVSALNMSDFREVDLTSFES